MYSTYKDRLAGVKPGTAASLRNTNLQFDMEGINAFIPGFNQSSPRTQSEKLTNFISTELHQKNIKPVRIFSMADKNRLGTVKFSAILEALKKCVPSFSDELISNIPLAFQIGVNDNLSQQEFEMLFDPRQSAAGNTLVKPSAIKLKNQQAARAGNDEFTAILKYLAEILEKEGFTAAQFFKSADKSFNKVLTVDELKSHVKVMLPDHFAGLNYKKLASALDINNTGIIEEAEFIQLMQRSISSGLETSNY